MSRFNVGFSIGPGKVATTISALAVRNPLKPFEPVMDPTPEPSKDAEVPEAPEKPSKRRQQAAKE